MKTFLFEPEFTFISNKHDNVIYILSMNIVERVIAGQVKFGVRYEVVKGFLLSVLITAGVVMGALSYDT